MRLILKNRISKCVCANFFGVRKWLIILKPTQSVRRITHISSIVCGANYVPIPFHQFTTLYGFSAGSLLVANHVFGVEMPDREKTSHVHQKCFINICRTKYLRANFFLCEKTLSVYHMTWPYKMTKLQVRVSKFSKFWIFRIIRIFWGFYYFPIILRIWIIWMFKIMTYIVVAVIINTQSFTSRRA